MTTLNYRTSIRGTLILTPLLGTTWIFGLFAIGDASILFQYIFVILNSMQGVFIFLIYCVFNKEVGLIKYLLLCVLCANICGWPVGAVCLLVWDIFCRRGWVGENEFIVSVGGMFFFLTQT